MRLTNVSVKNFRAIRQLDIDFGPGLTVLHGVNAGGKTSLLAAIANGLRPIQEGYGKYQNLALRLPTMSKDDLSNSENFGSVRILFECGSISEMEFSNSNDSLFEKPGFNISESSRQGKQRFPVFVFYGVDRSAISVPDENFEVSRNFETFQALDNALEGKVDFDTTFEWFFRKQHEELLFQKINQDFSVKLKDLDSVRRAICGVIDGASDPYISLNPTRFLVSLTKENGIRESLALSQLSGGYRTMLALVADLARRMAQANPVLQDPLESEAIVLIDEIDLHLHPEWQQRVLSDLQRVFPNVQFIVSTHSPQVLSTVGPHQILHLVRHQGKVFAERTASATFGAESGHILAVEMGVNERPKNLFTELLEKYFVLIDRNQGKSEEALELRRRLDEISPRDTALDRADIGIKRRELMKNFEKQV